MKKLLFVVISLISVSALSAQNKKPATDLMARTGDHFMLQFTGDFWMGAPDSIKDHMKGFSRGTNVYFLLDKRFKGNQKFSVAGGIGVGSSNMYFKRMSVDINSKNATLPFRNLDSLGYFKKYKLTTVYLEIPLELRFTANPEKENRSFKAALGIKVGTMINAHNKGKTLVDRNGAVVNNYTQKESTKAYFNSTRFAGTARVGYGNFSVIASYQFNNIFKEGVAADIKLFQIGLCVSGL